MRYPPEHKQQARARIVEASSKAFRRHGLGGVGVDGLAKAAGVTSGAFYGHFKSKDLAFQEIATLGLAELRDAIVALRAAHGENWLASFIDFYLGDRRTCELGESCALQSLTPDVMRADQKTKAAYEAAFGEVVEVVAEGLTNGPRQTARQRALALLAMLSGGVTVARSVASAERSEAIAAALKLAAMELAGEGSERLTS